MTDVSLIPDFDSVNQAAFEAAQARAAEQGIVQPEEGDAQVHTMYEILGEQPVSPTSVQTELAGGPVESRELMDQEERDAEDNYFDELAKGHVAALENARNLAALQEQQAGAFIQQSIAAEALLETQFDPMFWDEGVDLQTRSDSMAALRSLGDTILQSEIPDPEVMAAVAVETAWLAVAQHFGFESEGEPTVEEITDFLQSDAYAAASAMHAGEIVGAYVQEQRGSFDAEVEAEQLDAYHQERGAAVIAALEREAHAKVQDPQAELDAALQLVAAVYGEQGIQVMAHGSPEAAAQMVVEAAAHARLANMQEWKNRSALDGEALLDSVERTSVSRGLKMMGQSINPREPLDEGAAQLTWAEVEQSVKPNRRAQVEVDPLTGLPVGLGERSASVQDRIRHEALRQAAQRAMDDADKASSEYERATGRSATTGRFVKR